MTFRPSTRRDWLQQTSLWPLATAAGSSAAAGKGHAPLQLVSAHFPPYTLEGEGARRGALVELVEAVFSRAGWPQRVSFYPWARAIHLASQSPRVAVFPLSRTPDREATGWQWLLPLQSRRFGFLNRSGDARIERIEQAQQLRIGVVRGSPSDLELIRRGFPAAQLVRGSQVEDLLRMLDLGMIDALYGNPVIFREQLRLNGREPSVLQDGLQLETAQMWLAAREGLLPEEVDALQAARRALQQDGSAQRMLRRYGLSDE